jgi:hypothetical protein
MKDGDRPSAEVGVCAVVRPQFGQSRRSEREPVGTERLLCGFFDYRDYRSILLKKAMLHEPLFFQNASMIAYQIRVLGCVLLARIFLALSGHLHPLLLLRRCCTRLR